MGVVRPAAPRPIAPGDDLSAFACGKPSLDDWLKKTALRAEREHTARTYVICDPAAAGRRVIGYYCLSAFSVERATVGGGAFARNAPTAVPAILLGRLAVDLTVQGTGLGAALLHDAVENAVLVSQRIGSRALLVEAIDEEAASFYRRYGFQSFPADPGRLFHRL